MSTPAAPHPGEPAPGYDAPDDPDAPPDDPDAPPPDDDDAQDHARALRRRAQDHARERRRRRRFWVSGPYRHDPL